MNVPVDVAAEMGLKPMASVWLVTSVGLIGPCYSALVPHPTRGEALTNYHAMRFPRPVADGRCTGVRVQTIDGAFHHVASNALQPPFAAGDVLQVPPGYLTVLL